MGRDLLEGLSLDEVGPQRLILSLVGAGGMKEIVETAGIVHVPGSVMRVDFSGEAGLRSYGFGPMPPRCNRDRRSKSREEAGESRSGPNLRGAEPTRGGRSGSGDPREIDPQPDNCSGRDSRERGVRDLRIEGRFRAVEIRVQRKIGVQVKLAQIVGLAAFDKLLVPSKR